MKLISLIALIFLSVLIEAPPLPFLVADLKSFANYAAAAYCKVPLTNWDCGEVCQATSGTSMVKVFNDNGLDTSGYIAMDRSKELIVVAYRGTVPGNYKNIITDVLFSLNDYFPVRGTKAHLGFYNAFRRIQPQVTNEVIQLHQQFPEFRIGFMGHSLGGALAAFSALDFIQNVPELGAKNEKVFLASFGQPRIGDTAFAQYADNNLNTARTIVRGDPIPRLPLVLPIPFFNNYKHFGEEYFISEPDEDPTIFTECRAEDPSCSESVPLTQLRPRYHSASYYGVSMRDCNKDQNGEVLSDDDKEFENYDFSKDPYFVYDPTYNYKADFKGSIDVKGVNGTNGVDGNDAKGVDGNGAKGINGGNGAKGVDGNGAKGINGGNGAKGVDGNGAKGVDAKGVDGNGSKVVNGNGAKGVKHN